MDNCERFFNYLNDLFESYNNLSKLLTQKLAAIASFDVATLDSIIREEQVYVLLARGFDQNIASFREILGVTGETLSQIIEELPQNQQPRFQMLHSELKTTLNNVKELNQKCQDLINTKLASIDLAIQQQGGKRSNLYDSGGTPASAPVHMPLGGQTYIFNKSI